MGVGIGKQQQFGVDLGDGGVEGGGLAAALFVVDQADAAVGETGDDVGGAIAAAIGYDDDVELAGGKIEAEGIFYAVGVDGFLFFGGYQEGLCGGGGVGGFLIFDF